MKAPMSQSLRNVKMGQKFWSIIFIQVTSHNGELFSFLNASDRMDFRWDKWRKWKNVLTPYSCHAFLVESYKGKSESGFGFTPDTHLCEFINSAEARTFNAAYLTKYNKIYEEGSVDDVNELSGEFGTALMDMEGMRDQWMDLCEKAAMSTFSKDVFKTFFGDNPTPLPPSQPWDKDLFSVDHLQGCCVQFLNDEEYPVNLKYIDTDE